jgi:hypothetical protein
MKNNVLIQNNGVFTYTFTIEDDGIKVRQKKWTSFEIINIKFDYFNPEPMQKKHFPWALANITIYLFVLFLYILFKEIANNTVFLYSIYILIASIYSLYRFFLSNNNLLIFYASPENLKLFYNENQKQEVDLFVSEILVAYQNYVNKFSQTVARSSKIDSLERLASLRKLNAISDDEFNKLKKEIIEKNDDVDNIGIYLN